MAEFKENFKGKHNNFDCILCSVKNDTQKHSFSCPEVNSRIKIDGKYKDIFEKNISKSLSITLLEIRKLREKYFVPSMGP